MQKYIVLEKAVGETPLSCAEAYRSEHPELASVPMAYAGRLDPMASGKLLVLLGDECKHQEKYHKLDKEYEFSVLLGIESDSLDVLGRLNTCEMIGVVSDFVHKVTKQLEGTIELPYPRFSSKTVHGKPLHTWTLEGRLDEIEIPTKESTIYSINGIGIETLDREDIVEQALKKVNSVPKVTDLRKAIGNDFRRVDVRADWELIRTDASLPDSFQILHFKCIASSGTYMRTLAGVIAKEIGTCGLAWSIHRTKIGKFNPITKSWAVLFEQT